MKAIAERLSGSVSTSISWSHGQKRIELDTVCASFCPPVLLSGRLRQVLCLSLVSLLDAPMIFWRVKRGEVQLSLRAMNVCRWPSSLLSSCKKFLRSPRYGIDTWDDDPRPGGYGGKKEMKMAPCPDNGWQCAHRVAETWVKPQRWTSGNRYIDPAGNIQGPFPIEKMRRGVLILDFRASFKS